MNPREKIESYLVRLSLSFQESHGTWVVSDAQRGLQNLIIALTDSLVIMRMNVMEVPPRGREKLFEELLRLNATDLVHGAYGIEGDTIILIDTLEAGGMGLEEFEASLDAIGLAVAQHYRNLSSYRLKA
ncbi:MAG TPA: YbjN domain-containing protein [Spirochaetia bacterium]|nr:YbjN domain-containing protein [Spirochaetia bacterium]